MTTSLDRAHVASSVPGRLRLKFNGDQRHVEAQRAASHLQDHPGVATARAHPSIGSVTVRYDTERTTVDQLLTALHSLGMLIALRGESPPNPLEETGFSGAAVGITDAVDRLDRRISFATGRRVNLKVLLPTGFLLFGVRNTLVNGLGLTTLPGFIMLWYAFDAFHKLHQGEPATRWAATATEGEPEPMPAERRRRAGLS